MKKLVFKINILIVTFFISISCTKVLDIKPASNLTEPDYNTIYAGAFDNLTNDFFSYANPGYRGLLLSIDAMGDDVIMTNGVYGGARAFYNFTASNNFTSTAVNFYYRKYYLAINSCNIGIEMYSKIDNPKPQEDIIYAQLLALRAMCHFDIVRLFQHTYEVGKSLPAGIIRDKVIVPNKSSEGKELSTVEDFYNFFLKDIEESIVLFEKHNYTRPNKAYINKNVAYLLAARMYLTRGTIVAGGGIKVDMDKAAEYAYKAQDGINLMSRDEFLDGFNDASNSEWMLVLPQAANNSDMSYAFMYTDTRSADTRAGYKNFLPDPYFKKLFVYDGSENDLTNPSNYDVGDIRFQLFEDPVTTGASRVRNLLKYPKFTYKDGLSIGDILYMRLAEAHLIEAEAKMRGGINSNVDNATTIINNLRTVRGSTTAGYTVDLDFILKERRRELWGEGVTGVYDMNRLGGFVQRKQLNTDSFKEYSNIRGGHDIILQPNGASFIPNSPYYLFQLPEVEILNNPKIIGQLPRL